MKITKNKTLTEILAEELPADFILDLKKGFTKIYKESYAKAVNDPAWGESWDKYMIGNYRHVLTNELLKKLAIRYNLISDMQMTEKDSACFCIVKTEKLAFTVSHVASSQKVPVRAKHREQYSKINAHLPQTDMFEDCFIDNNKEIFAIICHGESKDINDDYSLGFVGFSFTDEQSKHVLDHIPLDDISEYQHIMAKSITDRDMVLNKAKPAEPILKSTKATNSSKKTAS